MVNETIQYSSSNGAKHVYLLLLDASKAFDKVSFYTLFNMLFDKKMCPRTVKLLYYMYTQISHVMLLGLIIALKHLIYLIALSKVVSYRHYCSVYTLIICF